MMDNLEEELPNLYDVLQRFADRTIDKYRSKMHSHNASGNLLNNLSTSIESSGTNIKVKLSIADYFQYLENGRGPTKGGTSDRPLKEKILDWIRIKGITPRPDDKGRLPSEESLAYLISRKIHREGYRTAPQHCLKEAIDETYTEYKEQLEDALYKDFNTYYSVNILDKIKKIRI